MATPVRDDLLESALDDGRICLGKSILEGGRAFEVVRARLCGGASLVASARLGLVVLVCDRDRVNDLGFSNPFLELSATEGGLEGTLEFDWEEKVGGAFVAARLLGLSGTEFVCAGSLGFGGGISGGGGVGTIVILLGPILGRPPDTGMVSGCTRVTPTFLCDGWFLIRLGPGRAANSTRAWDIELIIVDVVESALLVILCVEWWERAEAGRTRFEGNEGRAGLGIDLTKVWEGGTCRDDRDGARPTCDRELATEWGCSFGLMFRYFFAVGLRG